jgi:hypothetical protein
MQRRLLLTAIVLVFASAVGVLWIKDHYGHINPKQVYSEAERTELIRRANAGDVKASWRLYLYYSFVRYDPDQREKWLLAGADAGDERAVYTLAMFYANVDSQRMDLKKASQWADVLEKYDAEEAKGVRLEIERVREYLKSKTK